MPEHQYLPIAFGQLSQGSLKSVHLFAKVDGFVRGGHFAGDLIGHFHCFAVGMDDGRLGRVPGEASAVVADQIYENTKEPGFEFALVVVGAEPLDNAQKRFLDKVLREFGIAGGTEGVAEEALPVGVYESIPSEFVARLASPEKLRNGTCVHVTL